MQARASSWLLNSLSLPIHPKNNHVFKARQGLYFLGHKIYPNSLISVDKAMRIKIKQAINLRNASSYQALYLPAKYRKQLPWYISEDNT